MQCRRVVPLCAFDACFYPCYITELCLGLPRLPKWATARSGHLFLARLKSNLLGPIIYNLRLQSGFYYFTTFLIFICSECHSTSFPVQRGQIMRFFIVLLLDSFN